MPRRSVVLTTFCILCAALSGCDSAARQFEAAKTENTEKALSEFITTHRDHKLASDAKQILEKIIQTKTYRWSPTGPLAKEPARDLEVNEDNDHHVSATTVSGSAQMPATISMESGRVIFSIDGLGSQNIRVKPNQKLGYTTYAGLKFEAEAVVAIGGDGTIVVDREGVSARDQKGRRFVSRKVEVGGKLRNVMIEPL